MKQRNTPIVEFKDEKQAYECLKEWQTRLFLDDWIIMIDFADNPTLNGKSVGAVVEQFPVEQVACITFRKPYVADKDCVLIDKPCHEKDLIHELWHLKLQQMDNLKSVEDVMFDMYLHRIIDQAAKSCIMAKYGVTLDYFKNF